MTSTTAPAAVARRSGPVLALLCVIYFMVILDAAIVRLAIPAIQRDLGLSSEAETWVANAYMLTFGALLLLGGRFADVLGRKRVLLIGVALFTDTAGGRRRDHRRARRPRRRAVRGLAAPARA
jgi:MFS family permease